MKKLFYFDPEIKGHVSKLKKLAVSYATNAEEAALFAGLFTFKIEDWSHNFSDEKTLASIYLLFDTGKGKYRLNLYSDGWHSHYAL